MALSAIRTVSIRHSVADAFREALRHGEFRPGEDLNEVALATKFQVSRGPVREALLGLAEEGLITHSPNRGFSVLKFAYEDRIAIDQVRLLLESQAMELARKRVTSEDFRELERIKNKLLSVAGDRNMPARDEAEIAFHRFIWQLSGNTWLVSALERIMVPYFIYGRTFGLVDAKVDYDLMTKRHQLYVDYLAGKTEMGALDCVRFHLGVPNSLATSEATDDAFTVSQKPSQTDAVQDVRVRSSLDGTMQPALFLPPRGDDPSPLLIHLHSWSSHYNNSAGIDDIVRECENRGWAMLSPDFRGPNERPEACASGIAIQDVLDAVEFAQDKSKIDPQRIYLLGGSGGGHMALTLAHSAPHLWAAASAWVPVTDLAAWYAFSENRQPEYQKMLRQCCGGSPDAPDAEVEYKKRSPVFHLHRAQGLPIDIQAGIRDGHDGSVPVSHSLRAFNVLAEANGHPGACLSEEHVQSITRDASLPKGLPAESSLIVDRAHIELFHRAAGPARLTIFQGRHETDFVTAIRWLELQRKPAAN